MSSELLDRYLDRTMRTWLGVPPEISEVPRLPRELVDLFLRAEERESSHRDAWGCWEHSFSANFRRGQLWVPEIDVWVSTERRELSSRVPLEPLWPGSRPFAVCLSHDVDLLSRQTTVRQAAHGLAASVRRVPGEAVGVAARGIRVAQALGRPAYFGVSRLPSTTETLETCIDIEREYGVSGSYFFTVPPPRPTPYDCTYRLDDSYSFRGASRTVREIMRTLDADGFDVGLHGSYRSAFEGDILAEEKAILEAALGRPVSTTRQHYLRYDVSSTPALQNEVGFRADSTLGFNRNVGFRAGTSMPFHPFDPGTGAAMELLEVPLVMMDFALVRPNSLELDRELGELAVRQLMEQVAAVGGVATLLVHPHALPDPTVLHLYRAAIQHGVALGAWFASLSDVEVWWRERESRLIPSSSPAARSGAP